ncbi:MAG: PIN domain-containing protein [Hyphomicrobiales bacterium]
MKPFLDTNILIYATLSDDRRRTAAERVLDAGGTISVQVLNEFTNVARRKLDRSWPKIEAMLDLVKGKVDRVRSVTVATHDRAVRLARDHGLSFYDALIVAAALEGGCDTLFTEDMQDGRVFGGLTIRNPFLESRE